jgi:hypothetical protein
MKSFLWILLVFHPLQILGQQRPLVTEGAATLEKDQLLFDIGVEFIQDAVFPFSGLKGDLTRAGVVGIRFGAADNVELQFLGTIQNVLNVEERSPAPNDFRLAFSGNSTSDFGDLLIATKVRLLKEGPGRPGLTSLFGVELPNASNENGLGNDETNVFSSVLLEKRWPRIQFRANLGLAILGDPEVPGAQDDLLTYGFAVIYPVSPRLNLLAETYGRVGPGGIGTEEQSLMRLGVQVKAAGMYWDVALLAGFRDTDPSTGVVLGISKEFPLRLFGN